jgi:transcriptional regulator with XRE-family HTH domain
MTGEVMQPPGTPAVLEQWRRQRGLSKQRLAELSDVSATYIRTIEAGFDDDGRPVVPSAGVILKLARGLAKANPDEAARPEEERRAYAELMAAAGYLDPGAFVVAPRPRDGTPQGQGRVTQQTGTTESESAAGAGFARDGQMPSPRLERLAVQSPPNGPVDVRLRDRRLHRHCTEILNSWEALTSEDQALILGIMEFVAERRRRRENLTGLQAQ